MDCIFCKIVAGEIPSEKVYESENAYAFYDINPQAKTHVLVIPKAHIVSADEIDENNCNVIADIFNDIPKIAKQVGLSEGYRVITNIGKHGAQSVFHLHFHILGGEQLSPKMC